jgi:hypothetical protein
VEDVVCPVTKKKEDPKKKAAPVSWSRNNKRKLKVPVANVDLYQDKVVYTKKKAALKAKTKKVTIPETPVPSQTINSPIAEEVTDPIQHLPNDEVLATFESQWNAGNFIHGAGMNLPDVDGSNGQVKS